jgi:DNA-binding transcriptional MerR regulator
MKQNIFLDQEEFDYLINSNYVDSFPELLKTINTPNFKISDIGPKHRDVTYWDQKEVLPVLKSKSKTLRKYTLKQAVWIKLIQQLRSFDVSLAQIRKIKPHILGEELNVYDLMQDQNVQKAIEQFALHAGHLDEYKELLKDPKFHQSIKEENLDLFEILILYTIVFKREVCYLILNQGKEILCYPFSFEKMYSMSQQFEGIKEIVHTPHIMLSISNAVQDLVKDWSKKDWLKKHSILSTEELKIIELIRDVRTKELTIYKNEHEIDRVIQVSKDRQMAVEEFARHILKNGYQTISVSTRNGKVVSFRNEISLKFN